MRATHHEVMYPLCGGCSSVGRALDCDSGCRGFKSHQSPHSSLSYFYSLFKSNSYQPVFIPYYADIVPNSLQG